MQMVVQPTGETVTVCYQDLVTRHNNTYDVRAAVDVAAVVPHTGPSGPLTCVFEVKNVPVDGGSTVACNFAVVDPHKLPADLSVPAKDHVELNRPILMQMKVDAKYRGSWFGSGTDVFGKLTVHDNDQTPLAKGELFLSTSTAIRPAK
ncbi:MAG: hypothetical protein V1495_09215 [Pseudomonadota bacterium]